MVQSLPAANSSIAAVQTSQADDKRARFDKATALFQKIEISNNDPVKQAKPRQTKPLVKIADTPKAATSPKLAAPAKAVNSAFTISHFNNFNADHFYPDIPHNVVNILAYPDKCPSIKVLTPGYFQYRQISIKGDGYEKHMPLLWLVEGLERVANEMSSIPTKADWDKAVLIGTRVKELHNSERGLFSDNFGITANRIDNAIKLMNSKRVLLDETQVDGKVQISFPLDTVEEKQSKEVEKFLKENSFIIEPPTLSPALHRVTLPAGWRVQKLCERDTEYFIIDNKNSIRLYVSGVSISKGSSKAEASVAIQSPKDSQFQWKRIGNDQEKYDFETLLQEYQWGIRYYAGLPENQVDLDRSYQELLAFVDRHPKYKHEMPDRYVLNSAHGLLSAM